jgi:nucleoid DNA-binding protein
MDKIIATLATKFSELTESDVQLSVETIVNAMSAQLVRGGRIELRGFGTFRLNEHLPAANVNALPEPGNLNQNNFNQVSLNQDDLDQDDSVVIFKPGSVIRERINNLCNHEHESQHEPMNYRNV